jgi:hypothetical protein
MDLEPGCECLWNFHALWTSSPHHLRASVTNHIDCTHVSRNGYLTDTCLVILVLSKREPEFDFYLTSFLSLFSKPQCSVITVWVRELKVTHSSRVGKVRALGSWIALFPSPNQIGGVSLSSKEHMKWDHISSCFVPHVCSLLKALTFQSQLNPSPEHHTDVNVAACILTLNIEVSSRDLEICEYHIHGLIHGLLLLCYVPVSRPAVNVLCLPLLSRDGIKTPILWFLDLLVAQVHCACLQIENHWKHG